MPPRTPLIQNTFRATLETSYEIDLWGKYRATTAAARAELLATEEAHRTIQLSLVTAVAEQYFSLLAADAQVELLQRTLAARGETLGLFKKRMTAGVSSEFHLFQAQAEEAAARSQLASAKGQREQVDSTLAVLLGRAPREVMKGTVERGAPVALRAFWVPSGLPSELLLRRPDVREAELRLRAADARISSVRAAMFPSIALTAMLGSESTDLSDLFSGPAGIFQFAAALVQPLFNAGRTKHAHERVKAQREMELTQYKKTMANAFGDVRKALAAQDAARQVFEAESQRAAALEQAHQHALRRLEGGVANRLEVLDVERQLLQAQLAQIEAARVQRSAVANLFKALGGGWSV
jgi:multidrug efflux system outer membrane protein